MALPPITSAAAGRANDQFERYFAEKIWALVPEIFRHEDGIAAQPGQLRALVEILAGQAAVERRSIDRLLADSRIAEADDWALTYIGELLGTRFVHPLNSAGRRADIGHTLAYRRRAGTPRLLERLADDIADWDGVAHEGFRHLFRFPHGWERDFETGRVTGTPVGGFPHMRSTRLGDTAYGPFEDVAHRPDFRRGVRAAARYNISKVNLFCWRKRAFPLSGITPFALDATHFTFDPSGRGHVPLFQQGGFDRGECQAPREWDVRMAMTCRRMGAARYHLSAEASEADLAWQPLSERRFDTLGQLVDAAVAAGIDPGDRQGLLDLAEAALDRDTPHARLLAAGENSAPAIRMRVGGATLLPTEIAGAGLALWADGASTLPVVAAMVDPALGLLQLPVAPDGLDIDLIHYGIMWPVGAGGHSREDRIGDDWGGPAPADIDMLADFSSWAGRLFFGDSRTYERAVAGSTISVTADTHIWANDPSRPYLLLRPEGGDTQIIIRPDDDDASRVLLLDGIWLGMALADAAATLATLSIEGRWDRVVLRDMTLDPGGSKAALPGAPERPIVHVRLLIAGVVEELVLDRCIMGSVHEDFSAGSPDAPACSAARVTICDSIVDANGSGVALQLPGAFLTMERTTVLGDCIAGRAEISDCLIDGSLDVQDAQNSCLRFSSVRGGGRIPAPYECAVLLPGLPGGSFESVRFGDPGYCVLTAACPENVREGGEHGTEMGVFNRALFPIKRNDLLAKLAEFAPVQADVQLVFES